jgi:hypothetical protein
MPFRETNRSEIKARRGYRWTQRLFVEDWGLKLLALAITLVLWFVVSGREVAREITVEPSVAGKPAPNCEVKEISATPGKVRVTGPAGHVNAIEKAITETISVEGRRESFDVPHTSVYLPDPKIAVRDKVNVHVTIGSVGDSSPKSRDTN